MALMHVHEKPPLLGLIRADVTPQIDEVIDKALAKWPEERYQSAGAFSAAFSEAISHVENIDKVVFVNRTPNIKLLGKARGNGSLFAHEVRVKLLAWRPALLSRTTLLTLVLCALLIATVSTAFVLNTQVKTRATTLTPTPTVPTDDVLGGDETDWPSGPTFSFSHDGRYHVVNTSAKTVAIALYPNHQYGNFSLSVTTCEIAGTRNAGDYYGVVIRSAEDQSHYYAFDVSASDGGIYEFYRNDGSWHSLKNGDVPSLKTTLGQNNTITVKAIGNTFTFIVNGKQVGAYTDSSVHAFATGEVGLIVEQDNTEVAFSNMLINRLS
ncbi:MAG: hypothetical protein NVS3B14_23050 [Ktedonobacteraceae bacterium]